MNKCEDVNTGTVIVQFLSKRQQKLYCSPLTKHQQMFRYTYERAVLASAILTGKSTVKYRCQDQALEGG